jgi:hypothetical protein
LDYDRDWNCVHAAARFLHNGLQAGALLACGQWSHKKISGAQYADRLLGREDI